MTSTTANLTHKLLLRSCQGVFLRGNGADVSFRYLSSAAAAAVDAPATMDVVKPLEGLPESFPPGKALFVLQKKGSVYGRLGRQEVKQLFESARPGTPKDAHVIKTALTEFKRDCAFVIDNRQAHPAVDGIIRALLPRRKPEEYPLPEAARENGMSEEEWLAKRHLIQAKREYNAAIFAANTIVDAKTGLNVSTRTDKINEVLKLLSNAVKNIKDIEKFDPQDVYSAMNSSEGLYRWLKRREHHPEKRMNKQARRNFLKTVKTTEGPNDETKEILAILREDLQCMLRIAKGEDDSAEDDVENEDELEDTENQSDDVDDSEKEKQ